MRLLKSNSVERVRRVKTGTKLVDVISDQKARGDQMPELKSKLILPKKSEPKFKLKLNDPSKVTTPLSYNFMTSRRVCPSTCKFVEEIKKRSKIERNKRKEELHIIHNLDGKQNYLNPTGECKRRTFTDPVLLNLFSKFNGKLPKSVNPFESME